MVTIAGVTVSKSGVTVSKSPIRVIFLHLLSAYSAEVELRIKIFMLKSFCGQNFVLVGHSGHDLQRSENLVFSKLILNCRCSDVYTAAAYSIQMYSIVKTKFYNAVTRT